MYLYPALGPVSRWRSLPGVQPRLGIYSSRKVNGTVVTQGPQHVAGAQR